MGRTSILRGLESFLPRSFGVFAPHWSSGAADLMRLMISMLWVGNAFMFLFLWLGLMCIETAKAFELYGWRLEARASLWRNLSSPQDERRRVCT